MSNTVDLYKNFNTQALQPKASEQKTSKNNRNFNLVIPPAIGALGGGIASLIYRNDVFQKAEGSKENFKNGLELGYETSGLYIQLQNDIKESQGKITAFKNENVRLNKEITNMANNAKKDGSDYSKLIETNRRIIKSNEDIIAVNENSIKQYKATLAELYDKTVVKEFKKFSADAIADAKKQSRKFAVIAIVVAGGIGAIVSLIINKVKNKKEN